MAFGVCGVCGACNVCDVCDAYDACGVGVFSAFDARNVRGARDLVVPLLSPSMMSNMASGSEIGTPHPWMKSVHALNSFPAKANQPHRIYKIYKKERKGNHG